MNRINWDKLTYKLKFEWIRIKWEWKDIKINEMILIIIELLIIEWNVLKWNDNNNITSKRPKWNTFITEVNKKWIIIIDTKRNRNANGSHTSDHDWNKILIKKCLLFNIDEISNVAD